MSTDGHFGLSLGWLLVGAVALVLALAGMKIMAPVVLVAGLLAGIHVQKA